MASSSEAVRRRPRIAARRRSAAPGLVRADRREVERAVQCPVRDQPPQQAALFLRATCRPALRARPNTANTSVGGAAVMLRRLAPLLVDREQLRRAPRSGIRHLPQRSPAQAPRAGAISRTARTRASWRSGAAAPSGRAPDRGPRADTASPTSARAAATGDGDRARRRWRSSDCTRIQGKGCGSSALTRNTNSRGRLTIPIRPSVDEIADLRRSPRRRRRSPRSTAPTAPGRARAAGRPVLRLLQRRAQRLDQTEQRRAPDDRSRAPATMRCRDRSSAPAGSG